MPFFVVHIFPGCATLLLSAWAHMSTVQCTSTSQHYTSNFRLWLAFCIKQNINLTNIEHWHVVAFIQLLNQSRLSFNTILSYMSAIKHNLNKFGYSTSPFQHPLVLQMLKSCAHNIAAPITVKVIFDVPLMHSIIQTTLSLPNGPIYASLFLLSFHGFFRISNLVPPSAKSFSITKHLARGDIIFAPPGAHVVLKWSKTIQNRAGRIIQLSAVPGSPLCPIAALNRFLAVNPAHPNQPFFSTASLPQGTATQYSTRQVLKTVLQLLAINPSSASFHTFRHSGATLAFQLGVPLHHIQAHGTWQSDAIWTYLSTATTNVVPNAFAAHISTIPPSSHN